MKKQTLGIAMAFVAAVMAAGCAENIEESGTERALFAYSTSDGAITITRYSGSERNIGISAKLNGTPIAAIGEDAFWDKQLTGVTISNGVTVIGDGAFAGNQLTSVTIGNSVVTIGEDAFSYNQLTSVTIPDSVKTIVTGAFMHNELTSVTIGNGVTAIGGWAFYDNYLTSVIIPNSVTAIDIEAFGDNLLTSITLPANVTMDDSSFDDNFESVYSTADKAAGTYILNESTWSKQGS
jgi:hypothetical protein